MFFRSDDDPQKQDRQMLWKLLNLLGIKDPKTGNLMTVHDAIKLKIFDVDQATLVVDAGKDPLSLDEALKREVIDSKLHDSLRTLHDLSKKYEINLYDEKEIDELDGSEKRVKVIQFNQNGAKSVAEAIQEGSVDSTSGLFRLSDGTFITITDAYYYGYLIKNETVKIKSTPLSFSDALTRGLFDENGFMVDRNSGAKHQLHSALANNLILDNLREVVDIRNDEKITVKRALAIGLLDSKKGLFRNSLSNEQCTFNFAHNSHLVSKPLTFKDLIDLELIKDNNKILSPTFTKWLSIQEAIDAGVLDRDNFRCVSKEKGTLLTLSEALESGIISLDGTYKDVVTNESLSIKQAVERGLISSVAQKSIFDIDGFKDPQEESFVSFNNALKKRILRRDDKHFVLITNDNRFLTLEEGVEAGFVRPEVYSMLTRHIGVFDTDKKELRVIDLAFHKLIDPISGYLLHHQSGAKMPLDDAIELQHITASGALLLSSLLSITLTTETITKTIKRYVTIRDKGSLEDSNGHPSFSEAVQRGLISIDEQTYRQPEEKKYYLVQDALNSDRVLADTEVMNGSPKTATLTIVTKSFLPTNEHSSSSETTSHSTTTERQQSQIKILKKMQKKIISLSDALHMGLITGETYELLDNNVSFVNNPDSFLRNKKYKLIDPQSSASLTLEEAIEREILNPNNITKFYIPFCKSLTIPQLIERDLLDVESQKIFHPETGDLLTLNEAIACDIVDKYSLIRNDKKHKITLREALKSEYLDGHSSIIKTKKGDLALRAGIDRGLFDVEKSKDKKDKPAIEIPLIGQTFPVVVQRKLFDTTKREVIHKISGKRIPIEAAIDSDYIMSVPCTPNADEVYIIDGLDQRLIDFENEKFRNPHTGQWMTLFDAYNNGCLIAKPLHAIISHEALKSTQITKEVKNVSHTVKTKSIDILDGWTMISANEVSNNKTGEIITLDAAKDQGVAIERVEVNQFTTSQMKDEFVPEVVKKSHERSSTSPDSAHITQVTVMFDPSQQLQQVQPDELTESSSTSGSTSTKHITIKKITTFKEILLDENGKEISQVISETPEGFERISESTLPADDAEFQEIISRFKEENLDFDNLDQEEVVTTTINNETVITRVVKEYNIVKNETEYVTRSWQEGGDIDIAFDAIEQNSGPETSTFVKESSPHVVERIIHSVTPDGVTEDQYTSTESNHKTTTIITTKHFTTTEENPDESRSSFETVMRSEPNVSETTTVEELPDGERKTVVITTTRVISNNNSQDDSPEVLTANEQYQVVTSEPTIDDQSTVHNRTKTIITSTIKSVSEKFSDDTEEDKQEPQRLPEVTRVDITDEGNSSSHTNNVKITKVTKNVFDSTSQFLDEERSQRTPVPAPRSKKSSTPEASPTAEPLKEPAAFKNSEPEKKPEVVKDPKTGKKKEVEKTAEAVKEPEFAKKAETVKEPEKDPKAKPSKKSKKTKEPEKVPEVVPEDKLPEAPKEDEKPSEPKPSKLVADSEKASQIDLTDHSIMFDKVKLKKPDDQQQPEKPSKNKSKKQVKLETERFLKMEQPHEPEKEPEAPAVEEVHVVGRKENHLESDLEPARVPVKEPKCIKKYFADLTPDQLKALQDEEIKNVAKETTTIDQEIVKKTEKALQSQPEKVEVDFKSELEDQIIRTDDPKLVKPDKKKKKKSKHITKTEMMLEAERAPEPETPTESQKPSKPETSSELQEVTEPATTSSETTVSEVETRFLEGSETESHTIHHVTKTVVVTTRTTQGSFENVETVFDQDERDADLLKHLETIVDTTLIQKGEQPQKIEHETPTQQESTTTTVEEIPSSENGQTTVTTTTIVTTKFIEPDQVEIVTTSGTYEEEPSTKASKTVETSTTTSTSRESSPTESVKSQSSEMVKVKQFTVAENIIEVIPLRDAIKKGKIEPKICRIMENGKELPLTVHDALMAKELSATDVVQIISSHVVVLMKDSPKPYLLELRENFNENKLREVGLYDKNVPCFVDPWTGNQITFQYFVFNLDVLDPSIYVKDQQLETYIPIQQALDEQLIDPQLGSVFDTKTNKRVPIFEAVDRKLVIQRTPQDSRIMKRPSTVDDLVRNGNINFETDEFIINNENLTLVEALRKGALDTSEISIRDPASGDILGYNFAADRGIVDIRRGVIINTITFEEILFIIAYRRGYFIIGKVQPISLNAALNSGLYDKDTNKIKHPRDNELLSIEDAVNCGLIDPKLTDVKDTKNNKFIVLKQAIEFNLVDPKASMIKNKKSSVPLDKALKDKLIFNKTEPFDLAEIITRNYYDPLTGKMLNPYTNKYITIREAIALKIININYIRIYDVMQDRVFSVEEAITNGLLDDQKGIITKPKMTLDKAFLQRILISFNGPMSLPSALNCNLFDPYTRKFSFDDKTLNLGEAIEHNKIAGNELVLYDPNRQKLSTLNEAISAGFLDPIISVIVDPITNKEVLIDDAMEQGLLVRSRSDVSLRDAVFDGLYDPESGSFSNVTSNEKLPLESAINRNVIDVKTTVFSVNNVTLDFEQAVEQGLIDPQNAMVKTKSGDNLNLIEAFDKGILNTISKPVRLHEAVIKHLYDESTGLFTDPETRKKITIQESLQESLIEPNSIQIQDPGSKSYLPISISFAIQTGLIDAKKGHVNYENKTYSLKEAFDLGILIDSKGPVSIQRTVHQGTFNDKLGRIADPFSDKNITVHEAMRKFVVNPHLPCYFDEEKEKLLSLNEACKLKLIDRYQGDFIVPYSGERLTINDAMKKGWIVDIECGNFTLYKILLMRLVNPQTGKLIHPITSRQITLNQAIAGELVDPLSSLIKNRNGKYFTLTDALRYGVVDGEKNLYWLSDSQSMPLHEAIEKGLIVSCEKPFSVLTAIRMRLYRPDTGKFVDPATNTYFDLKSGIDGNIINEDSTQFKNLLTKQTKPLSQAITDGDINVAKGRVFDQKSGSSYNYDVAFEKGLLFNVPRGLEPQKREVVHEEIPQIKIDLVDASLDASKPREMTLDDVIKAGILNPDTALIKDPQTGKFILLRVFIEKYQINLTQKAFIDSKSSFFVFSPHCVIYTREPKSFDDVIESKELNLATGKLVDPQNVEKDFTIQEAIDAGILDPDTILIKDGAKSKLLRVSEALRKGLIDPERSHVVDTVTSKLCSLESALNDGILKTPKARFDLLEALQFNLYDPTTGHFIDPFAPATEDPKAKANVTFEEALAKGLIDASTTMVRTSSDSEIIPISAAITSGVIDPVSGKITIKNPANDQTESVDFVKARELDLLVPAGERVRRC